jgi:hypothetical protein
MVSEIRKSFALEVFLRRDPTAAESYDRALHALRSWLDSWSGIGHVVVGMAAGD